MALNEQVTEYNMSGGVIDSRVQGFMVITF